MNRGKMLQLIIVSTNTYETGQSEDKPRQVQCRDNLTIRLVSSSLLYRLKAVFCIKKLCKVCFSTLKLESAPYRPSPGWPCLIRESQTLASDSTWNKDEAKCTSGYGLLPITLINEQNLLCWRKRQSHGWLSFTSSEVDEAQLKSRYFSHQ